MPRACGPCGDKERNSLDRRLLVMDVSHESFRTISNETSYTESALKRHKANHLIIDLAAVNQAKEAARAEVLTKVKSDELESIKTDVKSATAGRLETCASFLDQLREIRSHAANLLDQAEASQDMKAAGTFLRELREQIRLWAELEGKISSQPQITIINNPEWVELRTVIIQALEPYPEAREAVVLAIHK
jgi:hypothetical protein